MSPFVTWILRRAVFRTSSWNQTRIGHTFVKSAPPIAQSILALCPTYRRDMSTSGVYNVLTDKPFGPYIMMEIVKLLNKADVPSILWGNSLLDIYGVPTGDIDMGFLIDRGLIPKARELLLHAGLVQCTLDTCWSRRPTAENDYTRSNGEVHFHLASNMFPTLKPVVQLHIRDERIWTLPEEDNPAYVDGKNIIFASDERLPPPNWGLPEENRGVRGRCRHYPGSPVRILTPECYADALVLLMVRDRATKARLNWRTQISYMIEYGFFDPEKVHPATKRYLEYPPKVSLIDNLEKATAALGDVADRGKLHAEWAKPEL